MNIRENNNRERFPHLKKKIFNKFLFYKQVVLPSAINSLVRELETILSQVPTISKTYDFSIVVMEKYRKYEKSRLWKETSGTGGCRKARFIQHGAGSAESSLNAEYLVPLFSVSSEVQTPGSPDFLVKVTLISPFLQAALVLPQLLSKQDDRSRS